MVRPYLLYSVALAVAMWFTFVLYVSYDKNLLVLRQFDLGSVFGTGHWFTWVIMAVVLTRWGWNDIVSGLFIVGAFSALHEMVWYVFDGLTYPGQLEVAFWYYVPFIALGGVLVCCYVALSWKGKMAHVPVKSWVLCLSTFFIFDALWALAGFPVTVSLTTGGTAFFGNLAVNALEDLSWVIPGMTLL